MGAMRPVWSRAVEQSRCRHSAVTVQSLSIAMTVQSLCDVVVGSECCGGARGQFFRRWAVCVVVMGNAAVVSVSVVVRAVVVGSECCGGGQ